jgi:hypothetical protein
MPSGPGKIMNVQVDLILADEQRSASAFNMQALLRVMSIVGPAIIVLLIVLVVIRSTITKNELNALEAQWNTLEVKKEKADTLRNQISINKEILGKLTGLKNSRLEWNKQIISFMKMTPDSVQFRKMSITQKLSLNNKKKPERAYEVLLTGKAIGEKVDITVAEFTKILNSSPEFSEYTELAQVTDYDKDNSLDAEKNDRAFVIKCTYKPRIIE